MYNEVNDYAPQTELSAADRPNEAVFEITGLTWRKTYQRFIAVKLVLKVASDYLIKKDLNVNCIMPHRGYLFVTPHKKNATCPIGVTCLLHFKKKIVNDKLEVTDL